MLPVRSHSHYWSLFNVVDLFLTIVILSTALTFHCGKGEPNSTSSFCNSPRLKARIAYCAVNLVSSVSVTETAELEYSIVATMDWMRACDGLRNFAASAWMRYLIPR